MPSENPGRRRQLHLLPQLRGVVLRSDPDCAVRGPALQAGSQHQVGTLQVQVMRGFVIQAAALISDTKCILALAANCDI